MEGQKLDWSRDLPGKMAKKWPRTEDGDYVARRISRAVLSST